MNLKLWGAGTARTLRPIWMAEELGLDYKLFPIGPRTGETRTEEFSLLSPKQKIPLLADGDFVLSESLSICRYLQNKYPSDSMPLPSTKEERAKEDEWCNYIYGEMDPHTDVAEKFITMLFYVAPIENEDRLRDAGTLLLKPISPKAKNNNKDVCDLNSFRRICKYVKFQGKYYGFKQCEFKPNRLIAFAPCHSAWHGVPLQNLGWSPRNTIQSFIGSTSTFPLGKC